MLITLVDACPVLAGAPVVTNVQFAPRTDGSRLADIHYDLADDDSLQLAVAINVSADAGLTWDVPCMSLSGDVGLNVAPGSGRHVVWDVGLDHPDEPNASWQVQVIASDTGVLHRTHSPSNMWIIQWTGDVNWDIPGNYEKFARADVLILPAFFYWGVAANEARQPLEKIREINPGIKIIGYTLPKTIQTWFQTLPLGSYARDVYDRTEPFWSYTTEGDTLLDFKSQIVFNILDPACRDVFVSTFVEHHRRSANRFDGVFWDYFNNDLWIHPNVDAQVDGEPDMDGDGIPQAQDPDERVAYREACSAIVTAVRDSLGEDFIQIFNGQRAYGDVAFANLADGLYYELFPTLFFPDSDMAHALDPAYEHNLWNVRSRLRAVNGGPYIGFGNIWRNFFSDQNGLPTLLVLGDSYRAVALLTDCYSTWVSNGQHVYGWPEVEINLGPPLGPTEIAGNVYTRQFRYGSVKVTMTTGRYPNPFDYEIRVNGRVIQALDIPYHFP